MYEYVGICDRCGAEHRVAMAESQEQLREEATRAGWRVIEHRPFPIQRSTVVDPQQLDTHCQYTADYIEPALAMLVSPEYPRGDLEEGIRQLRGLASQPDGNFFQMVYRTVAVRDLDGD